MQSDGVCCRRQSHLHVKSVWLLLRAARMGKLARHLQLGVCGVVRVELERDDALLPGDLVVGVVHLTVSKPIASAQLSVTITGTQRLRWFTTIDEVRIPHWRSLLHLHHTIELSRPDAMFLDGELQYPFSFQLPKTDLPPTLQFQRSRIGDLEDVRTKVEYTVEATLRVDSMTKADLHASRKLTIDQPLVRTIHDGKPVSGQQENAVKLLCLVKSGSCSMQMELPTDVFNADSIVEAHATVDIHTVRRLKYVKVALCQDATIDRHSSCRFSSKRLKSGSRVVCSRRFEPESLGISSCGGLAKLALQLPLSPRDKPKHGPLLPTLTSHFLGLEYFVAVECYFALAKAARVRVPVTFNVGGSSGVQLLVMD